MSLRESDGKFPWFAADGEQLWRLSLEMDSLQTYTQRRESQAHIGVKFCL